MLDTNICSFIIRERPRAVLERLQIETGNRCQIVVSVITYYEMLLGTIGRKASPRHAALVSSFTSRLNAIVPWDPVAAQKAMGIRRDLEAVGLPISPNDTMIAGHALAMDCVLVTNNTREFSRVQQLRFEDWTTG